MVRSLLMSGAASLALATGAFAADLPNVKGAPVYTPPPPELSWTGLYVGVNGGFGGDRFDYHSFVIGNPSDFVNQSVTSSGFLGGGTLGFNYQFANTNFVAGLEGDFEASTVKGETTLSIPAASLTSQSGTKLDWLATARGRLGMSFGNVLPYVTGGAAFSHMDTFGNVSSPGGFLSFSNGATRTGWTVGAGVEYAITHNLSFKTEYLYVDLGKTTGNGVPGLVGLGIGAPAPGVATETRSRLHIVRAGLDWKFDWSSPPVPVAPKY